MTLSPERMRFIANIANEEWTYDLPKHESDTENEKEFEKHASVWKKVREDYLASSDSAEELHEFVKQHHWGDDGVEDFVILIENTSLDKNTARLVFWLIGPEFYRRNYENRAVIKHDHERRWWDLIHRVMENTAEGKYKTELMPDDYKQDIRENEYWENEPYWDIKAVMYGEN